MQPAEPFDELIAGADVEVIGVAKDDLGSEFVKLPWADGFHRALGSDWHEDRGFDQAPSGFEDSGAGFGGRVSGQEAERRRSAHGVFQTV